MIGGSNNPEAYRMNGKLLYDAIRQLVRQDIHGNEQLPERCSQDVTNYVGLKSF